MQAETGCGCLPVRIPTAKKGGWSASHSGCFVTGKEPVIFLPEAAWASEPVCTPRKILPDRDSILQPSNTQRVTIAATLFRSPLIILILILIQSRIISVENSMENLKLSPQYYSYNLNTKCSSIKTRP